MGSAFLGGVDAFAGLGFLFGGCSASAGGVLGVATAGNSESKGLRLDARHVGHGVPNGGGGEILDEVCECVGQYVRRSCLETSFQSPIRDQKDSGRQLSQSRGTQGSSWVISKVEIGHKAAKM